MTTLPIHQRPTRLIAAAAAVAALTAGAVAFSVSDDSSQPSAPGDKAPASVQKDAPRTHHAHPTTSGGHVMLGL
jgi:hypothetical protein